MAWSGQLGAGPVGAGVLLAANPVGGVLGLLLLRRSSVERARRATRRLVALSLLPLLACAAGPPLWLAALLVLVSGAGMTVTTVARVAFAAGVPDAVRARALGVAGTGLVVGQGLGVALAGGLAEVLPAAQAVALCAALALVLCVPLLHRERGLRALPDAAAPLRALAPAA